ncbi:hypothetical protein L21SP5_03784 [Salinivirga cyanobacteriivorans]|uniref:Uncharacterized protein n=1 Tax=Salinivirga cyanobacteriivorans TaxID=1307839 RepID=A0A0S2I4Q4_9BACT|nr:hypothetical protein [Salinivirga cyanobacteriivorans]ALO17379.1 hypothetical protein L21SP5_03784 [Salinivirga cyanobacteriivorans]
MATLTSIWAVGEPLLFLFQLLLGLRFKYHTKVSERQFDVLTKEAFRELKGHLVYFGASDSIKAPEEMYCRHLKSEIKQRDGKFVFLEGELHLKFLKKFHLPRENNINGFLTKSFFFIHGYSNTFNYLLFIDRIKRRFGKNNTILHYLSIPEWRKKKSNVLSQEVTAIKKITDKHWNDRYLIPKNQDIAESKPTISRAIDKVLANGVISEKSVFNLASSEKLVFVHKYAEGWDFYNRYIEGLNNAKEIVNKWKKSNAQNAKKQLEKAQEKLKEVESFWLQAPVTFSLEKHGFQKLFNRMDGVYVLPLSMIPVKYHNQLDSFFGKITDSAKEYVNSAIEQSNPYILEDNRKLKYLILSHVIPVNEILTLSEERSIEISSPALSRMLFTSYLSKDNSNVSNLYINDVVRNVDFLSLLSDTKTDNLIRLHFEDLKRILWELYNIDLMKPVTLSIIDDNKLTVIIQRLEAVNNEFGNLRRFLKKRLVSITEFYTELNRELNEIKK